MEINWHDGVSPTSHGSGPFHPAIRNGKRVLFWPNITFATEDEAARRAVISLADALQPTIDHVAEWNIREA
jgi:hypothetical protein